MSAPPALDARRRRLTRAGYLPVEGTALHAATYPRASARQHERAAGARLALEGHALHAARLAHKP